MERKAPCVPLRTVLFRRQEGNVECSRARPWGGSLCRGTVREKSNTLKERSAESKHSYVIGGIRISRRHQTRANTGPKRNTWVKYRHQASYDKPKRQARELDADDVCHPLDGSSLPIGPLALPCQLRRSPHRNRSWG